MNGPKTISYVSRLMLLPAEFTEVAFQPVNFLGVILGILRQVGDAKPPRQEPRRFRVADLAQDTQRWPESLRTLPGNSQVERQLHELGWE